MDVTARKPAEAGDTFRHFTGREYVVIAIARDDDQGQDLVIHRGLHDGRIWSRTMTNFMGNSVPEGKPRFVYTGGLTAPTEAAPTEAPTALTREDYDDLEAYAVAAMLGVTSTGYIECPKQLVDKAFDVAEAMLAGKKKRLGDKPDYTHDA